MRIRCLLLLACCGSLSAQAAMITLTADRDASLFKSPGDNSNGGGPGVFAGTNGMSSPRRGLLAFLLGGIPAGSIITDVQLTMTVGQASLSAHATIELFEMTSSWTEGSNAPSSMIAMTGAGLPAQIGDSTWNSRFYSPTAPTPWTTPGGDFDSVASGSLTINDPTLNVAHSWLSTPGMVADVQEWLDHPGTNQGWLLKSTDETVLNSVFGFYSSEWTDPNLSPKLQITYVPEPATVGLVALGLLPLLAGRRGKAGRLQRPTNHTNHTNDENAFLCDSCDS